MPRLDVPACYDQGSDTDFATAPKKYLSGKKILQHIQGIGREQQHFSSHLTLILYSNLKKKTDRLVFLLSTFVSRPVAADVPIQVLDGKLIRLFFNRMSEYSKDLFVLLFSYVSTSLLLALLVVSLAFP